MTPTLRLPALLFGALAAACGSSVEAPPRANVLLVSLDSARRDLFGVYGRRPLHAPGERTSPHLDRLAAQGVLFENTSATSSWTLPSHLSLLSGRPELVHAVDQDGQRPSESIPLLAEILRAEGYRTAGVYSGPYLEPDYGFGRGFDRYESAYGDELAAAAQEVARQSSLQGEGADVGRFLRRLEVASHRDRSSKQVTDRALGTIERAAEDGVPFFLFAHYFDPHYDYLPPAPFDHRFDPDYAGSIDGEDFIRNPAVALFDDESESGRRRIVGERDLEHVLALYEGEVAATDREIGRLFARLDELELAERTVVAVVSDHGDEFFEHDGLGHRRTLFEEVLAVPFLLRYPEALPSGVRVDASVSLVDLMPTILELVGVDAPHDLPSRSLLPIVRSEEGDRGALARLVALREVQVELDTGQRTVAVDGLELRILETWRQGNLKITRERRRLRPRQALPPALAAGVAAQSVALFAREELRWIDLAAHPDERPQDHSRDFDDPAARAALEAFRAEYARLLPLRRSPELDPATEQRLARLRGLGYVGSEAGGVPVDAERLELPLPGSELP